MFKWKYGFIGLFIIASILLSGISTHAGSLKSNEFLDYSETSRDNYIVIAAGIAGLIAGQNRPEQSRCIDQWVAENREAGYGPVLRAMRKFPNHHPSAVIVAVLQKACGRFAY